jgi:hypothetical protein
MKHTARTDGEVARALAFAESGDQIEVTNELYARAGVMALVMGVNAVMSGTRSYLPAIFDEDPDADVAITIRPDYWLDGGYEQDH